MQYVAIDDRLTALLEISLFGGASVAVIPPDSASVLSAVKPVCIILSLFKLPVLVFFWSNFSLSRSRQTLADIDTRRITAARLQIYVAMSILNVHCDRLNFSP